MYGHIQRVIFISQKVDKQKFNDILKSRILEVYFDKNDKELIERENKFIRILYDDSYIDLLIRKITLHDFYTIHLGQLIDTNKTIRHNEKH